MDDYKVLAEQLKDEGNECFQNGDIAMAITKYTEAIDLDPDNHVYYSNRSAAYMRADSKSKALHDAEKCIELCPTFVKGYSRLGAAQQSLKRFDNAIDTFKKGIQLDPSNQTLWSALVACQAACEDDKKVRFAEGEIERQREDDYLRRKEAAKERAAKANTANSTTNESSTISSENVPTEDEADLLNSFFSEVSGPAKPTAVTREEIIKEMELDFHEKYSNQDLGRGVDQVERLTGSNYQFKNLNPYEVLQLDIDATEEDIKNRYRKLSTKVHPDKLRDVEGAREAFEEVKKAYQRLCEPDQKANIIRNIEFVKEEVAKDRKRLINKGVKEADMPFTTFEEECHVRLLKHFADIEMQRRRSETNLRAYSARERGIEDEEKEKVMRDADFENSWAEKDRREKRVGSWRDFQNEGKAKVAKISSFKEDSRTETKHGVVKLNEWKKSWR